MTREEMKEIVLDVCKHPDQDNAEQRLDTVIKELESNDNTYPKIYSLEDVIPVYRYKEE